MSFDALTLECFVAVTDTSSFTQAAKKVSRTQSAVSQQITKLEKQVGHSLFNRGKQLTLTLEGEILLPYARKIIQLNRDAMDRFQQPELKGQVRFGLPEDFATVFLSEVLAEYGKLHPRLLLNIECDLTLNLFERFKNNEFDLVLVKMTRPQDLPNGINVWSEALEWVGNPSILGMDSEEPIPLVLSPQPCVYRARAIEALEKSQRNWRIVFSSHSFAGTIAAVRANMGISVIPRNMVPKDIQLIRSHKRLPTLDDTSITLLKHHDDNLAVNAFERFVLKKLKP